VLCDKANDEQGGLFLTVLEAKSKPQNLPLEFFEHIHTLRWKNRSQPLSEDLVFLFPRKLQGFYPRPD